MDVGVNYPWFFGRYGFDFGPDPGGQPRPPRPDWESTLVKNLDILSKAGVKVVRSFILSNGFSYGRPVWNQEYTLAGDHGLPSRQRAWSVTFEPPDQLDPLFIQYFRVYLEKFREKRMQAIPSLISHGFFEPTQGYHGNRYPIALDSRKRKKFLDTVLGEFLKVSQLPEFEGVIYAWEVANEPLYNTTASALYSPVATIVPTDEMKVFLSDACDRIEAAGHYSTVGHRFYSDFNTFRMGTRPQFHYYAKSIQHAPECGDPKTIPTYADTKALIDKITGTNKLDGAFIGEFNGSDDHSWAWPDLKGKDNYNSTNARERTLRRLQKLQDKEYKLALLWPDGADPPSSRVCTTDPPDPNDVDKLKYSRGVLLGICDFTGGHC